MEEDNFDLNGLSKYQAEKSKKEKEAALRMAGGDPELEAILLETKQTQQDTLASTQNSVRMLKETVQVADRTNEQLSEQGRQLREIDEGARRADAKAQESYAASKELHKYKGLIPVSFKNMLTGRKKKDQDKELDSKLRQADKADAKRERMVDKEVAGLKGQNRSADGPKKEYADTTEQQIDENLDEMEQALGHLQMSAKGMHDELQEQKTTLDRIDATTQHTDYVIKSADRKIQEFM